MNRFTVVLSCLTLFSAAFGVVAAPDTAEASAAAKPEPAATMVSGLCGLTPAQVQGIVDDYDFDPPAGWLSSALQQPFNCSAYGELCNVLGPQDAHNYVCNVWSAFDDGAAMSLISQETLEYIDENAVHCTPDAEECSEACTEFNKPVRECYGVVSPDGSCTTLTWCSSLESVFGFHNLTGIPPLL